MDSNSGSDSDSEYNLEYYESSDLSENEETSQPEPSEPEPSKQEPSKSLLSKTSILRHSIGARIQAISFLELGILLGYQDKNWSFKVSSL
jgi:hypothetical protein